MVALGVFLVSWPMLARSPQSGDGAELVNTAWHGGVLHPPGFPLQAWLDRLFIHLPFGEPAMRLACLSLLAHAGAVWGLGDLLRRLRVSPAVGAVSALAFGFFPAVWYLGVQPEVFALAEVLVALSLRRALILATSEPRADQRVETGDATAIRRSACWRACADGAWPALCLAQSPVTVVALPAWIVAATGIGRKTPAKWNALRVLAFATLFGAAYLSLPLLRGQAVWPDWGKLVTAREIARHFLREEFGVFSLSPNQLTQPFTALSLLGREVLRAWHIGLVAVAAGFPVAWRLGARARLALLGTLAASLLFLGVAEQNGDNAFTRAVLERFLVFALLPLSVLLGLGAQEIWVRARERAARTALALLALTSLGILAWNGSQVANASRDRTLEAFTQAIGQALPPEALYVAAQSEEYFMGVPLAGARDGRRFPLAIGRFFELPWYNQQVRPLLEPRLASVTVTSLAQTLEVAQAAGISRLASIDEKFFSDLGRPAELRGLIFVAGPGLAERNTAATARAGRELCPLVLRLHGLPAGAHGFSRQMLAYFARGMNGAGSASQAAGQAEAAAAAERAAHALLGGEVSDEPEWIAGCRRLMELGP